MIRKRVSQLTVNNKLKELEREVARQDFVAVLFVDVEEDGRIVVNHRRHFDNMFQCEEAIPSMRGVTADTVIICDPMIIQCCDLYFPADPLLYFLTAEGRKEFAWVKDNLKWLAMYHAVIDQVLQKTPDAFNIPLPGFDDQIVKDLMENYDTMPSDQMVERYRSQEWFSGKINER